MEDQILNECIEQLADLFSDYDLLSQPMMRMQTEEIIRNAIQKAQSQREPLQDLKPFQYGK